MSLKALIENVTVEIGFGGKEGIAIKTFWQFVAEQRERPEVADPIFGGFLGPVDYETTPEADLTGDETIGRGDFKGDFQSWLWDQFMAFDSIFLNKVVNLDPLELQACPELKTLPYPEIKEKYHDMLRITTTPSVQEKLLFGKETTLRPIHREIVSVVAKSREGGVPQTVLCKKVGRTAKALNPIIKKLIQLGILARSTALFEAAYTFNVLHTHFAPRNEVYALMAKKTPQAMPSAAVRTPSAAGLGITLTTCLSKQSVCRALGQSKDGFLTYEGLAKAMGIPYFKAGPRRKFLRLLTALVKKNYLGRCRAFDPTRNRPVGGVKLLKLYRNPTPTVAPATQAALGSITYGVPMEHQIYSAILAAGDRGISSLDLRKQLYDMDRKIFEAYTDKILKPKDGNEPLVVFSWEFVGKLRFHRFFSTEAFKRLQLQGGAPKAPEAKLETQLEGVEIMEVAADAVKFDPSITGAAREDALLNLVRSQGALVSNTELTSLVQAEMKANHKLDRKTLTRTIDKLVAENRLYKLGVKVSRLNGTVDFYPVLVDHALGTDHPVVAEFVTKLRDEACLKVRTLTPIIYKNMGVYSDGRSETISRSKPKSTISQLLAVGYAGSLSAAGPSPRVANEDASDAGSASELMDTPSRRPTQCPGVYRSVIACLKLLHLELLGILAGSSDSLHKQRTISAHDIFKLLTLECFLSIIPVRMSAEELTQFAILQENMLRPIGSLPPSIHRILFDLKNGYKAQLLRLLQQLEALGLVVPLSKDCIDASGVVHVPRRPMSSESSSLSHYYYLPEWFDLRRLLNLTQDFVSVQTFSVATPSAAAGMWAKLQVILTTHKEILHPRYDDPILAKTLQSMTFTRSWAFSYRYKPEEIRLMDSYIENRKNSNLADDAALIQQLALHFRMWPFKIRSYFLQRLNTSNRQTLSQLRKMSRPTQPTDVAILPVPKRQRNSLRKKTPAISLPVSTLNKKTIFTRRRYPNLPSIDNELLHMFAIVKFRALDGPVSWADINRALPGYGPDCHRNRVMSLLRYIDGQNRAAELLTKWRAIYARGIASGELQEKSICPSTGNLQILAPAKPDPRNPTSYLPTFLPSNGFNLREQFDYFMAHSDYELIPEPQVPGSRLPLSLAELYARFQITLAKNNCKFNVTNVLYLLPAGGTIPLPAPGKPLRPKSELASFHEDLHSDHQYSETSSLDLHRSQPFTTRFRSMVLDEPPIHSLPPPDYTIEVTKVALKMIILAPRTTSNAFLSASFYSQFPHFATSSAAVHLDNAGCITKDRIKGTSATRGIRESLNIACGYSSNKYRPTDKFLGTLLGASPFHLFLLARLSHRELVRLASPLSPPVSSFVGPGGMMALLSNLSNFEIDLDPAHVPEAVSLAPTRSNNRTKLRDDAFKHDFGVRVRLLDSPLCQAIIDSPVSQEHQNPQDSLETARNNHQSVDDVERLDSKAATDLFHLIDEQGPIGLPVVQILQHFSETRLYETLTRLVDAQPPLIHRVGMDVCRFVSKNHYNKWLVCVQPTPHEDGLREEVQSDSLMIAPHPWTFFDGTDNEAILTMYANATLSHIVKTPGISLASLLFRLQPTVNRDDLYFLLDYLKEGDCIFSRHFVQPVKPGPFSPRESFREVTPRWDSMPHHPRGVTCFWPKPHFYLQRPDLSIILKPPRTQPGPVPKYDPFRYSPEDGAPPIFSERRYN